MSLHVFTGTLLALAPPAGGALPADTLLDAAVVAFLVIFTITLMVFMSRRLRRD